MDLWLVFLGIVVWITCEYIGGRQDVSPSTAFWLPKIGLVMGIIFVSFGIIWL